MPTPRYAVGTSQLVLAVLGAWLRSRLWQSIDNVLHLPDGKSAVASQIGVRRHIDVSGLSAPHLPAGKNCSHSLMLRMNAAAQLHWHCYPFHWNSPSNHLDADNCDGIHVPFRGCYRLRDTFS